MMKPKYPARAALKGTTEAIKEIFSTVLHDDPPKGPPSPVKHRAAQQTKLHRAKRRKSARKAQKLARKPNR
jgi:hypothetical protein